MTNKLLKIDVDERSSRSVGILCLLAGLTVLSIFPLDILLPSYPSMALAFAKAPADIASSISVFVGFFAISQLIVGPLSDTVGRKAVLLAGLSVTLLAVLGCALAEDYETFLAFRMLQAMGCSVLVLSQALIQDFFNEARRHSIRIYLVSFSGVLISVSPLLGTWLQNAYDWHGSFYLSAIIATGLIGLMVGYYPPESKPVSHSFVDALRSYKSIFMNRTFIGYWAMAGFAFACHFTFIIVSPLIFLVGFGVADYMYALILLIYGVSYLVGGVIAKTISARVPIRDQIALGFSLIFVSGLAIFFSVLSEAVYIVTVLIPMIVCTAGTTLVRPAAASQGMRFFSDKAGAAGAAGATVVFTIGAVSSAVVSYLDAYLLTALASMVLGASAAGLVLNPLVAREQFAS